MKVALKQSAMPTDPTANQDFTDGVFSSDVKLFLPFFNRATANNTNAGDYADSFGAMAGSAQFAAGFHCEDNVATSLESDSDTLTTQAAVMTDSPSNTDIADAVGSILSNGGRLAWSDWNANELINALLLGGSDVEVSVLQTALNGTTDVTLAHGLSGAPDVVLAYANGAGLGNGGANNVCRGFYDVASVTYRALSHRVNGTTTTAIACAIWTDCIAAEISNSAITWKATLNDIGATTLDVVASAATTDTIHLICIKVPGGAFQVGTFLTRTSAGNQADITGMSAKPKLALYLPTFMTVIDTIQNGGTNIESAGFGVAVDNEGVTEQGSMASWADDGIVLGVTDALCRISNTKAGMVFGATGALAIDWSISTWDSVGVTHNYSTADATGRYVAYLVIAPAAAGGGGLVSPLAGKLGGLLTGKL